MNKQYRLKLNWVYGFRYEDLLKNFIYH